ncbi:MAG: HD domain-containing protein [Muricomes sp.]
MKSSAATQKMIEFLDGNHRDINHFLKVYTYARTIGELEKLDERTQETLEIAAVIHDIACPLCREKYGDTDGKHQEVESAALVTPFLQELECDEDMTERICYLVSHHHTYTGVDGLDYQILLEADFLVNAQEAEMSKETITEIMKRVFKTETGTHLLKSIFRLF